MVKFRYTEAMSNVTRLVRLVTYSYLNRQAVATQTRDVPQIGTPLIYTVTPSVEPIRITHLILPI